MSFMRGECAHVVAGQPRVTRVWVRMRVSQPSRARDLGVGESVAEQ